MPTLTACPICKSTSSKKPRLDLAPHPYVECTYCGLYYQQEQPEKVYEAFHESAGNLMSDADKGANDALARALYNNHLIKKCVADKYLHLDVGSKYPYLGHCLQNVSEGKLISCGVDGIDEGPDYGRELGVAMFRGDFENMELDIGPIHLLTMVHCIEHLYKPLETLKKIASMMAPDGIFFVRCPDSQSPGIERDFTKGHYDIHPLIWNEQTMYEALHQLGDCFRVEETYPMYGQRDYLLRPIQKRPTVGAGYIVKNEERDLPPSLESIKYCVDLTCIRDTGSTDKTKEVAIASGPRVYFETYTGASRKDDKGDWKLWSFGKARNEYVKWLDDKVDWVLWMDADDTVTPEAAAIIRRAPYMQYDIHSFHIKTGADSSHTHHRLWRTKRGVEFQGACHEYPGWPGNFQAREWAANIVHNGAEGVGESGIMRNLRILEEEAKEAPTHRTLFYLANTYRDAYGIPGNTDDQRKAYLMSAVDAYSKYIDMPGVTYWDELMFSYIYKARCLRWLGNTDACIKTVREGMAKDPTFAELPMEACYVSSSAGNQWGAIGWALQATNLPFRHRLFAEKNKYEDQPLRMLTHGFNNLGFIDAALVWGRKVSSYVNDPSWNDFLAEIGRTGCGAQGFINLLRPGALGDVLMTGWLLDGLRKKYPAHVIRYYTKCKEMAEMLDVDEVIDSDDWDNRRPGLDFPLIGYPIKDGYPNVPMKKHIIEYLGEEVGVTTSKPTIKCGYPLSDLQPKSYITIHVKAGWSAYKNWSVNKWEELVAHMGEFGKQIVQLGGNEDPLIPGCTDKRGIPLSHGLALIKDAWLHIGPDSFSNHAAGIFETPAVILFGSTSPTGSGYPHALNLWKALPCSPCYKEDPKISRDPRGVCENPPGQTYEEPKHACLDISAINVYLQINTYLAGRRLNENV